MTPAGSRDVGVGSLADENFEATRATVRAELRTYEFLVDLLGEGGCTDWTTDYYDRSIEIFGVAARTLSEAQQEALHDAGFDRCWTHEHPEEPGQPGERAYVFVKKNSQPPRGGAGGE